MYVTGPTVFEEKPFLSSLFLDRKVTEIHVERDQCNTELCSLCGTIRSNALLFATHTIACTEREREERMFPLRQMYPTCRCICHQLIESMQTIHTAPYQICSFLLLYLLTFSPVYVNDTVSLKFHYLYLPLSLSRGGGSFHYELLSYCLQSLLLLMTHLKVR